MSEIYQKIPIQSLQGKIKVSAHCYEELIDDNILVREVISGLKKRHCT